MYKTESPANVNSFTDDDIVIDVTIPLQCLIKNSKLKLRESGKSDLPGFYDPCVGEEKKLKIEYTHKDRSYNIILSDKEPVQLPIGKIFSNICSLESIHFNFFVFFFV